MDIRSGTSMLVLACIPIIIPCLFVHGAELVTVNGIPHMKNGSEPESGTVIWELEEMWRTGGEDSDMVFGQILRVRDDEEGNVYVLDAQLNHIEVFSPRGEHLRTVSREGDGPGEIRQPGDFFILPDGTINILTLFPGKLTKLSRSGDPLGSMQIGVKDPTEGGFVASFRASAYGTNVVCGAAESDMTDGVQHRTWFACRIDTSGRELARCYARDATLDFSDPVFIEKDLIDWGAVNAEPGPEGKAYTAPEWDTYRIHVHEPDGKIGMIIERDFETRLRTDREQNLMRSVFEAWGRDSPVEMEYDIEKHPPVIRDLFIDGTGRIWVENNRSRLDQPDGILMTFDVFQPDGRFENQVRIRCDADSEYDELYILDENHAVIVTGGIDAFFGAMAGGAMSDEIESDVELLELVYYSIKRVEE